MNFPKSMYHTASREIRTSEPIHAKRGITDRSSRTGRESFDDALRNEREFPIRSNLMAIATVKMYNADQRKTTMKNRYIVPPTNRKRKAGTRLNRTAARRISDP
jgi:hypothetical protein